MNDMVKTEQEQSVIPVNAGLIGVIDKVLASDTQLDPDYLERLLNMQERVMAKQAESAYARAMMQAQGAMRRVAADADNTQTRSRYASYAQLDKALRPIYTEHGFALSFDTENAIDGEIPAVNVICYVMHSDGHTRKHSVVMPADGKGAKGGDVMTRTHAMGSAVSYGMRYLLKMIFNVAVGEDDDDGNGATKPIARISAAHLKKLRAALRKLPGKLEENEGLLCKVYKVDALEELQDGTLDDALSRVASRAKRLAGGE